MNGISVSVSQSQNNSSNNILSPINSAPKKIIKIQNPSKELIIID